ncbi:MAG: hypothetical protein WCL32_15090 [Planctomycetota bacterium]
MIVDTEDLWVLNHCARHFVRAGDLAKTCAEAWRFPLVTPDRRERADGRDDCNEVTFVYRIDARTSAPGQVAVLGTFATLYEPLPLRPIRFLDEDTGYFALTCLVPKGQVHRYLFVADGQLMPDPVNPQRVELDNGKVWSRFFTDGFLQPLALEMWEVRLLTRLTQHILPFRAPDAENFLRRYADGLRRPAKDAEVGMLYHLIKSVGEVNGIDKLLAREESHRLIDYRICLLEIDALLRRRYPHVEPSQLPSAVFVQLYQDMASNRVDGWDYSAYESPQFFLYLLRRHAVTAAFGHPRYSGNVGAAAWAYLAERFADSTTGEPLFDWRAALEKPLGRNDDYR